VIHVCTWLWKQDGMRTRYTARHVNVLANMVARNLSPPHEFVCFTDQPEGIACKTLPLPATPSVNWPASRPNCFRRLWLFSKEAAEIFPGRIVNLDLDAVVCGPLDPLYDRPEDFVGWRDPYRPRQYNGSMWLLTAGSRTKVWCEFKGNASLARMQGRFGSDQGWLSATLPNEATWTDANGVLSYKSNVRKRGPNGARIVFFHGQPKPWDLPKEPWIKEHYR
jgi:hypothetical protein